MKLAATLVMMIIFFAPICWGDMQLQPPEAVTGGSSNGILGPPLTNRPAYCPEGSYASGVQAFATAPGGRVCVGCLTNLRLLCTPFNLTRSLEEVPSPLAIVSPEIAFRGDSQAIDEVSCPPGSYVSSLKGWGTWQNRFCVLCLTQMDVTCTAFGPVEFHHKMFMSSWYQGRQTGLADSHCGDKRYVVGVQAWVAGRGTENCAGCLTGAQVICKNLDNQ